MRRRLWPNVLDLLMLALVVIALLTNLMPVHAGAMDASVVNGP